MKRLLLSVSLCIMATHAIASDTPLSPDNYAGPVTRIFLQQHEEAALYWADVRRTENGSFTIDKPQTIEGFPKLDPKRQTLVRMAEANGKVVVGIRDDDNGKYQSGWVLIDAGVGSEAHGDHSHWHYDAKPVILDSRLDDKQGNPAHVYNYDGRFYLANDALDGYTRINPERYKRGETAPDDAGFISGGGRHITIAVVGKYAGYATWINADGPEKGRVDVTPVLGEQSKKPAYSFHLPTGTIHGATVAADKVFFAPADGICWVKADRHAEKPSSDVVVHHLPLGMVDESPLRTGAFEVYKSNVLCVSGNGKDTFMAYINAVSNEPEVRKLDLKMKAVNKATTPTVVTTVSQQSFALVFQDHDARVEADDYLSIVSLDPDQDGDYSDMKLLKTIPVGPSKVSGHFGHHALASDADGEIVIITNPGDGTLQLLSTNDWTAKTSIDIGGMPTGIVAVGGRMSDD